MSFYFLIPGPQLIPDFVRLECASKASINSLYPSVFLNSSSLIPSSSFSSSSSLTSKSC